MTGADMLATTPMPVSFVPTPTTAAEWADAYNALGISLLERQRFEEALAAFDAALQSDSDHVYAMFNRGVVCRRLGRDADAIDAFRGAIALEPHWWQPHLDLGLLLIRHGHLPEGWKEYEWRWQSGGPPPMRVNRPQPIWNGERCWNARREHERRTIVLCAESGHGDMIQFVRLAALVKPLVGRVLVEAPARLRRLLATCPDIDGVIAGDEACDADYQLPLLSVPHVLRLTQDAIPGRTPYLFASPSPAIDQFFAPFGDRLKVGVCWTGSPSNPLNALRSCRPDDFAALSTLDTDETCRLKLFSLQLITDEPLARHVDRLGITRLDALQQDFADAASIIMCLDVVITIDTAIAHLAGALGRPVWLLLHDQPDARWMIDRTDSPWYPTMRIFRQPAGGTWADVFAEVATALTRSI